VRRAEAAVPAAGDEHLAGDTQSGLRADGVELLQGAEGKNRWLMIGWMLISILKVVHSSSAY